MAVVSVGCIMYHIYIYVSNYTFTMIYVYMTYNKNTYNKHTYIYNICIICICIIWYIIYIILEYFREYMNICRCWIGVSMSSPAFTSYFGRDTEREREERERERRVETQILGRFKTQKNKKVMQCYQADVLLSQWCSWLCWYCKPINLPFGDWFCHP